ncbi:CHAT domain-containing protein [Lentzea waywayandensis]|uniref:CHAT domain-containing protein n=1 Tax=Lentzea waywayandensis TaxID=84724 RepID=A0A1I6FDP8_9PSEU|nr:CHAT domain-containing protein [Lentzea waywayandensis]SFR28101.1 CHAT domain-containing protein [Lentzea waywayandensis]
MVDLIAALARDLWVTAEAGTPLEEVCAAIGAGEPRRALRLLEDLGQNGSGDDAVEALRYCATYLDAQWWPGGTDCGVLPPPKPTPRSARTLLSAVAEEIVPVSLVLRTLATGARRAGEDQGAQMLGTVLLPTITEWQALAEQAGDGTAAAYVELLRADVERRAGRHERTAALLEMVHSRAADMDALSVGLVHLAAGDAALTPLQSPETLGFDLAARGDAAVLGDARARAQVLDHYRNARAAFVAARSPRGVASTDLRLAWLHRLDGRPDAARETLEAAAEGFRAAADGAGHVLALTHLAVAGLSDERPSPDQPDLVAHATAWVTGGGSRSFALGCAGIVHCAANAFHDAGDVEASLAAYELSRRLVRALGDPDAELTVISDLGELYARLNSRGATIATIEETLVERMAPHDGLSGTGQLDPVTWLGVVHLLAWLGDQLIRERDPDSLAGLHDRAALLFARAPGGPRPLHAPVQDPLSRIEQAKRDLTVLREARGGPHAGGQDWAAMEQANVDIAARCLADVVAMADVMTHQTSALAAAQRGDTAKAESEFAAALAATDSAGHSLALAVLAGWGRRDELLTRTRAYFDGSPEIDPEQAATLWLNARAFGNAKSALGAEWTLPSTMDSPVWRQDWEGHVLRARIALGLGRSTEAASFAADGAVRFERWFSALTSDAFRVAVLDDAMIRRLYQAAAAASIARGEHSAGFAAADRTRSFSLGALVADAAWAAGAPAAAPGFRAWRQAQAEWIGFYDRRRAAWRQRDPAVHSRTADELAAAQDRLDSAGADLERRAPGATRRRSVSLPPATAESVAHHLAPGTLLVEYLFGDDELLVWALTATTCTGWRRDVDSLALTGAMHRLHAAWQGDRRVSTDEELVADTLLGPVRHLLDHHDRIVVVPFGTMNLLPFHALPHRGRPLGHDRAVSHLPSAALVPQLSGRPAPRLSGATVVGDPATHPSRGLHRLPGARVEALAVARLLQADAVVGDRADEAGVRSAFAARHPILHMATHGLLDDEAPNLSALVLAGRDQITLAELLGVGLDIDLAVLSACDTGRGSITMGGDVVGLARGLLAAGARHSVVALWPVDDQAGCLTMVAFAEEIARGTPVARALSAAQQRVRLAGEADRRDWYAQLAEQAGAPVNTGGRRTTRDVEPLAANPDRSAGHPSWWAPFVHIGI